MENTQNNTLPPFPASDPEAMARNRYDGFYGIRSRDYWKDAEISLNKVQENEPCLHFFTQQGYRAQCARCHIGFFGPSIKAIDGKLFINNIETVL